MKKFLLIILASFTLISCGILTGKTPLTTFIVKNTSDKTLNFTASIYQQSQLMGPQIIKHSYTLRPNDSVITRKTYYTRDGKNPQIWFTEFNIFPSDGVELNDPNVAENWVKSSDTKNPTYTFTLNKEQ